MKKLIFIFCLLSTLVFAQETPSTLDFKLGVGLLMWEGSTILAKFDNEITKKWNRYFSNSISVNFALGSDQYLKSLTVWNGDINCFISPFGNQRKHNFKIGTGVSMMYIHETRVSYRDEFSIGDVVERYTVEKRRKNALNIIIDYEVSISKRYIIGMRGILQPYTSALASVKLGIKL